MPQEKSLVEALLAYSTVELNTTFPPVYEQHFPTARKLIEEVAAIYGQAAKTPYFETSLLRYEQYFAIAMELPAGARILEVGSAPGHVSIGLSLLGHEMTCMNLNTLYRSTYPSPDWIERLGVLEHNFEEAPLPFGDESFDAVFFTEVMEHVAVKPVIDVLKDLRRVSKPGATLVLSTPNVNNISNVAALLHDQNIFWRPEMFYGSYDRHNREFTPGEVAEAVLASGFGISHLYGFNCHSNWRSGGIELTYRVIAEFGDSHPLLRNTTMLVGKA